MLRVEAGLRRDERDSSYKEPIHVFAFPLPFLHHIDLGISLNTAPPPARKEDWESLGARG